MRPSVVEEVLSTRRVLRFATRLEARPNGDLLIAVRPSDVPETAKDYDADLLAIEQFAYDLDVVRRHTDHLGISASTRLPCGHSVHLDGDDYGAPGGDRAARGRGR